MNFPSKESQIANLANSMAAGLTLHPTDFPNVDPTVLTAALSDYTQSKTAADTTRSNAAIATAGKQEALAALEEAMKNTLKVAEADCSADPAKLTEIGWGPKAAPVAMTPPQQPKDFLCISQGDGCATFQWKKAAEGSKAACFMLFRRQMDPATEEFGSWAMINFFYDCLITVEGQPKGVKLEYRIVASNPAGQSIPSNTEAIVL